MSRVVFAVPFAFGMGGIPRTVFLLAGALADRGHDVEVLSLLRSRERPFFELHPDVELSWLMDFTHPHNPGQTLRRPREREVVKPHVKELDARPTALAEDAHPFFSALTDQRLQRWMANMTDGILVATRPELGVAATRFAGTEVAKVLQVHNSLAHRVGLRAAVKSITRPGAPFTLDAFLTLTDEEMDKWRPSLEPTRVLLGVIPNASPFSASPRAPLVRQTVVTAGRLEHQKGFERLVQAWRPVSKTHPDWQLEIYGEGRLEAKLRAQVQALGLEPWVHLAGLTDDMEGVLDRSSVFAMSSRHEGLPMVLLEAMSKGVPPVSFDCPEGPRQLINDGVNGLLVPEGDVEGLTAALTRVIGDAELRRRLGAAAAQSVHPYDISAVADRWEELFRTVMRRRRPALWRRMMGGLRADR